MVTLEVTMAKPKLECLVDTTRDRACLVIVVISLIVEV